MRRATSIAQSHSSILETALEAATRDELGLQLTVASGQLDVDADAMILTGIGLRALRACLPSEILSALEEFASGRSHILRICNLPQQRQFPATPLRGFTDECQLAAINALHLGLLALLDLTPYAVDYENNGKLMRNVVPNPDAALQASSWGSGRDFFWHTDNPHLPFGRAGRDPRPVVPGFLTFYTVRNEEEVATELLMVDQVVSMLSHDVREELHKPQFNVAAPASNDALDGHKMVLPNARLLDWHNRGHRARYDVDTTTGRNDVARRALDAWKDALAHATPMSPVLRPGEFLAFDNTRVVHRRLAFTPASEARWLRRCYAGR